MKTLRVFPLAAVCFASIACAQEPPKDLGKAIDALIKQGPFSGAVMVSKNGKSIYQKAAGYAHLGHKVPNNIETKFNLASVGKTFTAVAIAQLVEAGKMSYEDTVGKIDPSFPSQEIREKVKVKHLLTHTSGVGDIFTDEFFSGPRDNFRNLSDYMPLFQTKPLAFEPGSREAYSNGGFCLLGYLVEKASGMPYWDYVKKNIFDPAGMKNTWPCEMDVDTPNLAYGYSNMDGMMKPYADGKLRNNLFQHSIKGTPAGGSFSTVGDMTRFAEALKQGKILSKKSFETLIEPRAAVTRAGQYGYGWMVRKVGDETIVGHTGGFLGITCFFSVYLKSGYTLVVFANVDDPHNDQIAAGIRKLLAEFPRHPLRGEERGPYNFPALI